MIMRRAVHAGQMRRMRVRRLGRTASLAWAVMGIAAWAASASAGRESAGSGEPLPGTRPLTLQGDIGEQMVAGVDRFLLGELDRSAGLRAGRWKRDLSSAAAHQKSIEPNRERFRRIIGARDQRVQPTAMELVAEVDEGMLVAEATGYDVQAVRWEVLDGVYGEGLLLTPRGRPAGGVVAIGDCHQTPEMLAGLVEGIAPESQFARRLAQSGLEVVVPVLIDRGNELSVIAGGSRRGDVSHREMLYRAAYQMGRHVIGYEVQKVLAAVDWLAARQKGDARVGVVGHGQGGLTALYAAALDSRIDAVGVSGYFDSRQELWREPIDRNVFGLLAEFGDAQIATMVAGRLVVEACAARSVEVAAGGAGGPGRIETAPPGRVAEELARAGRLVAGLPGGPRMELVVSGGGQDGPAGAGPMGSEAFVARIVEELGGELRNGGSGGATVHRLPDSRARHARQYRQMAHYNERLVHASALVRAEFMSRAQGGLGVTGKSASGESAKADDAAADVAAFERSMQWYRDYFRREVIGQIAHAKSDPNVRSRLAYDAPAYRGWEVVLDVFPDVIVYGILLVPKDIAQGEKRPVVVCQHGLEGQARDVVEGDRTSYRDFASRLAQRGFVAFAPQHLYRGGDRFRTLQRKANPLGQSLFSVMTAQHEQLLAWLSSLEFVDSERIGFYGISYGGKSAMRIPALVEGYCLSICSSDYSDWIWRTVSNEHAGGYLAHSEYEIFEFDLGNTFNYAEMTALICPRPFMVERMHKHGPFADRLVAEYAKAALVYENLGIEERIGMSYFGEYESGRQYEERETFEFLETRLRR